MEKSDPLRELFQMQTVPNKRPGVKNHEVNIKSQDSRCAKRQKNDMNPI